MHVDDGAAECFACVFQVHCLFRRLRRAESHSGLPSQCARVSLRPSHIDANRPRRPSASAQSITDRKSTRLNSSHLVISYAVFCLKKKKRSHDHMAHRPQPLVTTKLHALYLPERCEPLYPLANEYVCNLSPISDLMRHSFNQLLLP